ncbi:alpha-L-fucosidase [Streptomyces sp. NRRL WC-3742]|uniref:alpha-L-fucosidase n=1 Tax=Streptomyces sp. NRRL WC-3742 TaxID=1463934 RepID=UPI0004CA700D|nr:alpha-L-fucosidase [Streptomyces sp. NRRL WC-3742]
MLGAILGVPVIAAIGSSAAAAADGAAQDRTASASGGAVSSLDPRNAGDILASLRFGMFVHFNPSSVVGREIGWGRNAYRAGEGPGNQYKDPSVKSDPVYDVAYRDFLPEADWAAKLVASAKAARMNYLVFTTKHHDGYPNFRTANVTRSAYPDHAQTPMGRSGRDLTREVAEATRAAGLKLGLYYSGRDWTQPDYVKGDYDTYFGYMTEHLRQLLTDYGKVDFLWYDHIPFTDMSPFRPPLLLTVPRDLQPGILVNDRAYATMGFEPKQATLAGDYDTPEERVGSFDVIRPWESCITVTPGKWSWQPDQPKSDYSTVVATLVATATGGGNLLFNVPPMKTGYLEDEVTTTLGRVGEWMATYGETIVGTRGGPYRPAEFGGATYRGDTIFVHLTKSQSAGKLRLPCLNAKANSITTFDDRSVPFTEDAKGDLLVDLSGFDQTAPDFVLKLTVDRPLTVEYATRRAIEWEPQKASGTNLAKGRPVKQHSTAYGGVPERAVDGNTDGAWSAGTTTHTAEDANEAWWQVDLGTSADIGQVWLYNRTDNPESLRLSNCWVMTSDTEFTSGNLTESRTAPDVTAVRIDGPAGNSRGVQLNGRGRFVRVQLEANGTALSLAEVEVYAR